MPNPVVVEDLEDRWRPLSDAEKVSAAARLRGAWALATSCVPDLEARMTAGTVSTDLVIEVVAEVALRALRNPEGFLSETIGGYSYSRPRSASDASGLYLEPSELTQLRGIRPHVGSIAMVQPPGRYMQSLPTPNYRY